MKKIMMKLLLTSLVLVSAAPVWAQEKVALAGAEVSHDSQYAYLGMLLPLPGQQLGKGFVQRYWLDYIAYQYDKTSVQTIEARIGGGEAALGYQQSNAGSWWGVYMGARYGETDVGVGWRINGIASHLVGDANYWARLRLQTTLRNQLRVGPEVIVQGDSNYSAYKVGAFVGNIMLTPSAALTLKAGVNKPQDAAAALYAGAEFYLPF
ncbi:MAG: cellulose biosynthesis protein BcsS [Thiobacillus sp.]|nr:cellulose biosynthesis protein BcsS [Thiobacillus sp.]